MDANDNLEPMPSELPAESIPAKGDEAMLIVSDGAIKYANPAAGRMFGAATASDLIGQKHLAFVHSAFHQSVFDGRSALDAGETLPPRERIIVRTDGKPLWVEVKASRLPVGEEPALLLLTDISERKTQS